VQPVSPKEPPLKYFLNGALVTDILIDTSKVAIDTIDYVAIDPAGVTPTCTRTVIIEAAPQPIPPPPSVAASSTPEATASTTAH